jgi:hypothetical protein
MQAVCTVAVPGAVPVKVTCSPPDPALASASVVGPAAHPQAVFDSPVQPLPFVAKSPFVTRFGAALASRPASNMIVSASAASAMPAAIPAGLCKVVIGSPRLRETCGERPE